MCLLKPGDLVLPSSHLLFNKLHLNPIGTRQTEFVNWAYGYGIVIYVGKTRRKDNDYRKVSVLTCSGVGSCYYKELEAIK